MIDRDLLHVLNENGDVRYAEYAAPIGEIYILGSESSLKALVFKNSIPGARSINSHFRKGRTESINAAFTLLGNYFDKSGFKGKTITGRLVMTKDKESKSLIVTIAGINLTLDLTGYTAKEIAIYRELLKIPPGSTISYGLLAENASIPRGARFAGTCMAHNNFPIIIPCHRVIKSDGSMGNYSGGVHIKKFLLFHEKQ